MDKRLQSTDGNYLFNVDILINARTNPLAMQLLLELLNNNDKVTDFKINSGMEMGRTIDNLLRSAKLALQQQEAAAPKPVKSPVDRVVNPQVKTNQPPSSKLSNQPKQSEPALGPADVFGQIRKYVQNNQLVRIRANRHGKQVSMPCRILNFDEAANTLSVYHVDEKQVYTFKLNEIDEFL
ncbi:hypothetical protein [Paenibacillus sp. sgz500958]|uniref:hypothetical protein n=1 Tax=Paenibacillus sp. sgz500958 TaxID=3242475 RepID=UPI0036D2E5FD